MFVRFQPAVLGAGERPIEVTGGEGSGAIPDDSKAIPFGARPVAITGLVVVPVTALIERRGALKMKLPGGFWPATFTNVACDAGCGGIPPLKIELVSALVV